VLDPADLKSQCKNTPFDEARFSAASWRTIVGGRTVYEHCLMRGKYFATGGYSDVT